MKMRGSYDPIVFRAERVGTNKLKTLDKFYFNNKEVHQVKKSYLLTGIEPTLWKNFKAACAHYDISMREIFIKHMQNIVSDYNMQRQHKPPSIGKFKKGGKKR